MPAQMRLAANASAVVLTAGLLFASAPPAQSQHAGHSGDVFGTVHFPISCGPAAQQQFDRAVAMLHSFFYPESTKAFTAIAEGAPACAMAHWGVAISQIPNPLVPPFDPAAMKRAQEAIDKARAASQQTPRERDWIEALAVFYRDYDTVDHHTRALNYEAAMAQLHERYPDDGEAAVFYALALNMAEDLSDKTYEKQIKAAAILEREWQRQPNHPGIAHYIIHSYDYAPLAEKGLPAARRYAEIAASAPHAVHMPSHIFSMLGLWQESIKSNLAGKAASEAYNAKFYDGAADAGQLHAMDFLTYAYLQGAQDQEAKRMVDERNAIQKFAINRLAGDTAHAAIPVRYAIERGDWAAAAAIEPFQSRFPQAEAVSYFGRALGAARDGDPAAAKAAIAELETRRTKLAETKQPYWANQVDTQIQAASAWTAKAEGRPDEALALMRQAAERDDASEKHVAMENRLVPMRELLAEMLLEEGQPAPALQAYEDSLQIAPNRFRSFAGAAQAAERLGDPVTAQTYREKLIALCSQTDTDRAELVMARQSAAKK